MKTIADIITKFPNYSGNAFIYKTGYRTFRISYQSLYDKVSQMIQLLDTLDLKKGDNVILWGYNSPEWGIVFLACACKGVVLVPIDVKSLSEFVEKIHHAVHAKVLFHSVYKIPPTFHGKTIPLEYLDQTLNKFDPKKIQSTVHEDDLLEIVYTSGTTGEPKGVLLTHKNLLSNLIAMKKVVGVSPDFTFLSVLPLSHLFEQNPGFLAPLATGSTIVYMRGMRPSLIFKIFSEESITNMMLVPRLLKLFADGINHEIDAKGLRTFFDSILSLPVSPAIKKMLLISIHKKFGMHFQFFVSGGAPLAPELELFWTKMGFTILQGYGLTESSPVLTANALEKSKPGSVGFALPGITLKNNEKHELYAKGDNITAGYFHKDAETKTLFEDGWLKTGDIGTFDEEGYLFLKGRQKDLIVTEAGVNVYPEDIEQALLAHPSVKDVCVLGLPTENGEEVHAEIILKKKTDLRLLIQDVNKKLDESQHILSYSLWQKEDFPRTTTLKIQKRFVLGEIQRRSKTHDVKQNASGYSKLARIIARINGIDPALVKPTANLSLDLKLTSVNRIELVSLIEQEYNIDIDEEEITGKTTVANIEHMIAQRKRVTRRYVFRGWLLSNPIRIFRFIHNAIILDSLVRIFCERTIIGRENVEHLDGPVIFVSNHVSYLDMPNISLALPLAVRTKIAPAARRDFFEIPNISNLKRFLMRLDFYYASFVTNLYLFPRDKGFKQGLEYTGKLLDMGWNVLFFPEGEHSKTGNLEPFRSGIGWLVKEMKVPVVPIKHVGLSEVMGNHFRIPTRGKVTIRFGKPIIPDYTKSIPEITQELHDIIEKM